MTSIRINFWASHVIKVMTLPIEGYQLPTTPEFSNLPIIDPFSDIINLPSQETQRKVILIP